MKWYIFILAVLICFTIILVNAAFLTTKNEKLTTIDEASSMSTSYDTQFHDTIEDILKQSNAYVPILDTVTVKDDSENTISINVPKNMGGITYYKPGAYKYSAESYVPSYEDSIYLSRSIGVVPRLDNNDLYRPSNTYQLNSIAVPYSGSDVLITNRDWLSKSNFASTYVSGGIPPEVSDNVDQNSRDNVTRVPSFDDRLAQLQVTFSTDKTDEVLAYEQDVSDLKSIQSKIKSYGTTPSLNIQNKITRPAETREPEITLPADQINIDFDFENEKRILAGLPLLTMPVNTTTTAKTIETTPNDGLNAIQRLDRQTKIKQNNKFKNSVFRTDQGTPLSSSQMLSMSDQ